MASDRIDRAEDRLARVEAVIGDLRREVDELRSENADLRRATSPPAGVHVPNPGAAPPPPSVAVPGQPGAGLSVGRRHMLTKGLAVAGAAAAGAVLADAAPAAAADGDPVLLGGANVGVNTRISAPTGAALSLQGNAILGLGVSTGYTYGTGVLVDARHAHLHLQVRANRQAPVFDTVAHSAGEMVVDKFGTLWYCGVSGTPGSWRAVAGPAEGGAFYPHSAPVRVYDSRPNTSPAAGSKTKLAAGVTRTISLRTNGASNEYGRAAMVQILLVNATAGSGNFTVWSAGVAKPQANTMVWGGSAGRFSTLAYTNMNAAGNIQVSASLATDLVVDVIAQYC